MPIPDVTTLSGRRVWFSHIDGDGWNNVSRMEAYREKPTIAATVVLKELIAPYPDLPVAVGVIGADIDERYGTPEAARTAAHELFALPQVEVATHTYTHPYQWSFFESYDRKLEERLIGPDESELKETSTPRSRIKLPLYGIASYTSNLYAHQSEKVDAPAPCLAISSATL